MLKITVNDEVCVGHGRCYVLAPDVFGPDDFGHCEVLVGEVDETSPLAAQARVGESNCPERAIMVAPIE